MIKIKQENSNFVSIQTEKKGSMIKIREIHKINFFYRLWRHSVCIGICVTNAFYMDAYLNKKSHQFSFWTVVCSYETRTAAGSFIQSISPLLIFLFFLN